ncbi:glycosyltransferase [Chloroflexota bacterium]
MNITLVGPVYPFRGGIAHFNTLLARALKNHGHHTQVISFKKQYPNWLYPGRSDQDPSKRPLRVDAEFLLDPFCPWTWHQTAERILQVQPDFVVIHWWTTFWAVPFAALSAFLRRKHILTVYLIHNVTPHEKKTWDPWLARLALSKGDAFLVQTHQEKQHLLYLMPDARVKVSQHPVYSIFTESRIPKDQAKKRLGLTEESPIILFFGIVRKYKGLKYLLEALALLRDQEVKTYLVIAGEFWEDIAIYTRQIEDLNLSNLVRIDDRYVPNEEVTLLLSAADLMVAPYVHGTQSGAAEVALGSGLPLIVTDIVAQGIPERNKDKITVVPAADSSALASAIKNLIQKPNTEESICITADDDWDVFVTDLEIMLDG